jgi:hypothetical protein
MQSLLTAPPFTLTMCARKGKGGENIVDVVIISG